MCEVGNVVLIIPMLAPLSSVAYLATDLTHWTFGGRVVAIVTLLVWCVVVGVAPSTRHSRIAAPSATTTLVAIMAKASTSTVAVHDFG
jgi:hypothetical protein